MNATLPFAFASPSLGVRLVGAGASAADAAAHVVDVPMTAAEPGEVAARWAAATRPETVMRRGSAEHPPILEVEQDPALGYRLRADGYGDFLVPPGGEWLLAELPDDTDFKRERLLAAQVMPLLSTLHGREVLHAGAVVVDGRAIGIAARSGTGKSSTLAHLVAQGAAFHADDVIALEPDPDGPGLRVHPGPGIINLDRVQLDAVAPDARGRLGEVVAETEKLHLAIRPGTEAHPLAALFLLERGGSGPVGTRLLLGSSYLTYGATPERLLRQFEVAARVDATVEQVKLTVTEDAPSVARRILAAISGTGRPAA